MGDDEFWAPRLSVKRALDGKAVGESGLRCAELEAERETTHIGH
jgi:hypothetical protein